MDTLCPVSRSWITTVGPAPNTIAYKTAIASSAWQQGVYLLGWSRRPARSPNRSVPWRRSSTWGQRPAATLLPVPGIGHAGSRPPSRAGPASHARVGRQRPALAAPADLLYRPRPLPYSFGRWRPLRVGSRLVHLQREGREKAESGGGGGRRSLSPGLACSAALTIPPRSAAPVSTPAAVKDQQAPGPRACPVAISAGRGSRDPPPRDLTARDRFCT